jgi:hypothetical protein
MASRIDFSPCVDCSTNYECCQFAHRDGWVGWAIFIDTYFAVASMPFKQVNVVHRFDGRALIPFTCDQIIKRGAES